MEFAAGDLDRFITIREAAARLAMSRAHAYRLIKEGRFPVEPRKVGGKNVVHLRSLLESAGALAEAS
jgi:excisionase family DNA binding protein